MISAEISKGHFYIGLAQADIDRLNARTYVAADITDEIMVVVCLFQFHTEAIAEARTLKVLAGIRQTLAITYDEATISHIMSGRFRVWTGIPLPLGGTINVKTFYRPTVEELLALIKSAHPNMVTKNLIRPQTLPGRHPE